MRLTGYANPIRNLERRFSPGYEERAFRDPGLSGESGLGSLRHTMPHLRSPERFQAGGGLDAVGRIYAASRPNLYNPEDPRFRQVRAALQQMGNPNTRNAAMTAAPGSTFSFPYADGGAAPDGGPPDGGPPDGGPPDLEALMEPDDQQSGPDQEQKQIVVEAMLALEGRHPDPQEAISRFIDTFGEGALVELVQLLEGRTESEQEESDEPEAGAGEEPDEGPPDDGGQDVQVGQAGGGLLRGPGSGQSDEIHGRTPSGRTVLLSDGEYVIDAPTVAALGDGSTHAGARRLDEFRKQIRKQAYGNDKQAKPMASGGQAIIVEMG